MNSFGTSSLKYLLCDPRSVRDARTRFRRDSLPLLARANSFYMPAGREASRGFILLPRSDYDNLDTYSTTLQLDIGDPTRPNNIGTLKNLSIVQAQCVTRGLASDKNALYLIELTDARGILHNQWFQFPITAHYNIRAPAYPQTFHPASMDSGTTWTWETMVQDMWVRMSAFLGAWPGFPQGGVPAGTPEGFWFTGVPAWTAMCDVLKYLGLTVACDLTQSSPYTIVSKGADDAAFSALQVKYQMNLEDDLEWIDTGAGRVPKTIVVLFRRRNSVYGTEETVTYRSDDPYQWDMSSTYSISITAPSTFSAAVGTHYIWSDFTVRYDMDNNPLAEDAVTAELIAQERVPQYFNSIYSRTSGYMSQTYAGSLPFTTGSKVYTVEWSQDYSQQSRQGWKTKITRGDVS